LAIASAIRYTVGSSAYGYRGYGDIFVFVFFGLVSTLGVNFLYFKTIRRHFNFACNRCRIVERSSFESEQYA